MIILKTTQELDKMKLAGKISARALELAGKAVEPGVSTYEIDAVVRKYIESCGAVPSFLNYGGYPASTCISVNDVVIHGIPSRNIILKAGDIVSIDVGAYINGYHGDNARTYACGDITKEAQNLIDVTRECFFEGLKKAVSGNRLGDIGSAVQRKAENHGYSVVRDFVGHGVGADLHEEPSVPNFGTEGRGLRIMPGMTIAIEPMINMGSYKVKVLEDEWTTVTSDGKLSAHYENTIAVTIDGPVILTDPS